METAGKGWDREEKEGEGKTIMFIEHLLCVPHGMTFYISES